MANKGVSSATLGAASALVKPPTDAQVATAVSDWLDDHPEATTTVEDGSITEAKLDSNLQGTVADVTALKSASSQYVQKSVFGFDFTIGAITAVGKVNTTDTTRIRSIGGTAPAARAGDAVFVDAPYVYRLAAFSSNSVSQSTFVAWITEWGDAPTVIPSAYYGKVIMILIRNSQHPSGSVEAEVAGIGNYVHYYRDDKPLSGRYLSVMGDSISAYQGYIPDGYDYYYTGSNHDVSDVSEMWWSVVCARTGMNRCIINAYSGSGVTQLEDSSHVNKVPMSNAARCAALSDANHTPDVIVIMGGLNDYAYAQSGQSAPLEWDGTSEPVDLASFTQQYAIMIKQIQTNYPNASIVACCTNFSLRGDSNGYTRTHTVGTTKYTQYDYDTAIEHVCGLMNIPYIDISRIGFNPGSYYNAYASDSSTIPTHPNARGQKVLGAYVADRLTEILGPIMSLKQVS